METDSPKISLGNFLEANQRLITVLGVFTALTLFANTIRPIEFGQFLSSLFLTLVVLIWLELWGRFPSQGAGWRLIWFENLTGLLVLVLVAYWVVVIHVWFKGLITILVFGGTTAGVSTLNRRYDLFNRVFSTLPRGRPRVRYAVGIALHVILLALSFGVALVIGPGADRALEKISTYWAMLQVP